MGFTEDLQQLSTRILSLKPNIQTEEATKMSMIIPFFQLLGYDVFNPTEFCPEYTADVGIKKGEKVDYAILADGKPVILIECKSCNEILTKHASQLFRYFGTTTAKFAILTNGIVYNRLYHPDEFTRIQQLRRQLATMPGWEALEALLKNIKRTQNNAELLLSGIK